MKQTETITEHFNTCDNCGRRIYPVEYADGSKDDIVCPTCGRDTCRACRIAIFTYNRKEDGKKLNYNDLKGCVGCITVKVSDEKFKQKTKETA